MDMKTTFFLFLQFPGWFRNTGGTSMSPKPIYWDPPYDISFARIDVLILMTHNHDKDQFYR